MLGRYCTRNIGTKLTNIFIFITIMDSKKLNLVIIFLFKMVEAKGHIILL